MARKWASVLAVVVVAAALCVGCQKTFTRQKYDTLYVGQPDYAVRRMLWEPQFRSDGTWTYVHSNPYYRAVIDFQDNPITSKKWSYVRPPKPEGSSSAVGNGNSQ